MYLTTKYNHSLIQTYDFAWPGAPTSGVVDQVKTFDSYYAAGASEDPGWNPTDTLFACFVGINDLDHWNTASTTAKGLDAYRDGVFAKYNSALEMVCPHDLDFSCQVLTICHSCIKLVLAISSSTMFFPSTEHPNSRQ